MSAYSTRGKSPVQVSRESFVSNDDGNAKEYATLGSLQRIADAMERISRVLDCPNTTMMAKAIIRMDKRLSRRSPLGPRKK